MTGKLQASEVELNAYVDRELDGDDKIAFEAMLERSLPDAVSVDASLRLNEMIRDRYADVLKEPVPQGMLSLAHAIEEKSDPAAPRRAGGALVMAAAAASLVLGGIAGWAGAEVLHPRVPPIAVDHLADNALGAHRVFAAEVRHPVEVEAKEEAHLVQWLSKRLDCEVKAPHLNDLGWRLIGGRLLPDGGRPAAQLMYQDATGRRVSLYIRKDVAGASTSIRLSDAKDADVLVWVDKPLAYAITGSVERAELARLARSVYEQFNPPGEQAPRAAGSDE